MNETQMDLFFEILVGLFKEMNAGGAYNLNNG